MTQEPAVVRDGGLLRLRLDLDYDGTAFRGWAAQPGQRTVAGVLVDAAALVLRLDPLADVLPRLVVAGRTDAGVHALGQVCHLDVPADVLAGLGGPARLERRLRGLLPPDVRLRSLTVAADGFDARFSALRRHYRYRVSDAPGGPEPLRRHDTLGHDRPLDVDRMARAARATLGLRDFAAFCKRRDGATTVRELLRHEWHREADGTVVASLTADAFCHSMVRSMVGALLWVGDGRRDVGWPSELLTGTGRDSRVLVVGAHGLTLVGVDYPPDGDLRARAGEARTMRAPIGCRARDQQALDGLEPLRAARRDSWRR